VFTVLLAALLYPLSVAAADISVTVDRNPVSINESFQIIFSSSESPDDDPDFSPLDSDFDVLNQSQSSNYSIINGVANNNQSWTLNVMAKQTGEITIPAIAFGDDNSKPVSITVTGKDSAPVDVTVGEDIFLKVDVAPDNPYVQAQVIYTLRLYRRVNIAQAALTEPELDNAVVTRLGEDKNYNTDVKGQKYIVTERQYAIFPQQSGLLEIAPLALTAQVVSRSSSRSRFNSFFNTPSTRTKKVFSKAITLQVKSVPEAAKGQHWLPAQQVQLKETWSGDISQMQVGEPLTRTVTLLATGTTVGQLPELISNQPMTSTNTQGKLKSYPDQPVLKEQQKAGNMVALREEKVAFIPSKAGVYHLPAIEIPWWNTQTQQMEVAKIAATTVTAVAGDSVKKTQQQPIVSDIKIETPTTVEPSKGEQSSQTNVWIWVSGVLAMGGLLTVFYFLSRRARVISEQKSEDIKPEWAYCLKAIKKACQDNNAKAAKDALIQWGRMEFNESSLGRIALKCEAKLKQEILGLNQYLYAQQTGDWNGQALAEAIKQLKPNRGKSSHDQNEVLQPLYRG
jgi:hypothetical protein